MRTSIAPTAAAALAVAATTFGIGSAAAQPNDYTVLLVNPNEVTDSTAYSAGAPVQNPNNQPGVEAVYTHRDGSRQVTETVWVLQDSAAATAALNAAQTDAAGQDRQRDHATGHGGYRRDIAFGDVGRRVQVDQRAALHPGQHRFGDQVHRAGGRSGTG